MFQCLHTTGAFQVYVGKSFPSRPVVLKVGGAPPWGGANTLQGGRDVTDGEKKKRPPTCHWLVKAPSVAKCKGLD